MKWLLLASKMTFQKFPLNTQILQWKDVRVFQMISDGIKLASTAIYCTPNKFWIFTARFSSKQSDFFFTF